MTGQNQDGLFAQTSPFIAVKQQPTATADIKTILAIPAKNIYIKTSCVGLVCWNRSQKVIGIPVANSSNPLVWSCQLYRCFFGHKWCIPHQQFDKTFLSKCVCVLTIWRDVKLLLWDSFSMLFINLQGAAGNVMGAPASIFMSHPCFGQWLTQEWRCRFWCHARLLQPGSYFNQLFQPIWLQLRWLWRW